eukprot:symbB.v1.2.002132.t1/scaffold106.1/size366728/20
MRHKGPISCCSSTKVPNCSRAGCQNFAATRGGSTLPDCPSLPKTSLWRQICPSEEFVKQRATELFQYLSTALKLAQQAAEASSEFLDAADICANLPIFLGMQDDEPWRFIAPVLANERLTDRLTSFSTVHDVKGLQDLVSSGTMANPSLDMEEATESLPTLLKTEICDVTPRKADNKTIIMETRKKKVLQRAQTAQEVRNDSRPVQSKHGKDYRRSLSAPERLQSTLNGAGQHLESAWFTAGDKLWKMLVSSRQPQLICASFGMSTPYWTTRQVR